MLEKMFKLKENNTTVKTEVLAGITTFMTMAYILAVNPSMLAAAGMDKTAVLMATCIASFIGTLAMAMLANYPFALAPGMGLNAYFAYTVCGAMGYDWKIALMAVFAEGLIFIVLSLTNVREAIFNAIPTTLKKGVSVGIGFFIAFLGLQDGHIVVNNDSTLVTIVDFTGDFHTLGIGAILALIGLFIISILYIRGVKGAILIGIAATWILGMIAQAAGLYIPDAEAGFYSLYPVWGLTDFTSLGETFGQCFKADFSTVRVFDFVVIILSFLFVDMFDTLGTLIGVANKAQMLDENDKLIKNSEADKTGEICVSGTAVTMGYFNNREKTDSAFVQNPLNPYYNEIIYRTGDLGYYNERGEMCFSSRKDFQIKHNGHRIELGEIEMAINSMDGIQRACCIYEQEQNKIYAFYEGNADNKSLTHYLVSKIPKFMIPEVLVNVEAMPLTKNGKIDRKALMEGYNA